MPIIARPRFAIEDDEGLVFIAKLGNDFVAHYTRSVALARATWMPIPECSAQFLECLEEETAEIGAFAISEISEISG